MVVGKVLTTALPSALNPTEDTLMTPSLGAARYPRLTIKKPPSKIGGFRTITAIAAVCIITVAGFQS
jgi:hypothetical protein